MKNYISNSNLNLIPMKEMKSINGGGPLQKYGEEFGEKVTGIIFWVGLALVTKKFF